MRTMFKQRGSLAALLQPRPSRAELAEPAAKGGLMALLGTKPKGKRGVSTGQVGIPDSFEADVATPNGTTRCTILVDGTVHTGPEGGKFRLAQVGGEPIGFRLYLSGWRYALSKGKPTWVGLVNLESEEPVGRASILPVL